MIEYNVKIKGSKVVDNLKIFPNTKMNEISLMVFLLNKKIAELIEFDCEEKIDVKYPIDSDGNRIEEDEGK